MFSALDARLLFKYTDHQTKEDNPWFYVYRTTKSLLTPPNFPCTLCPLQLNLVTNV